jgi:hypothetical protein
LSISFSKGSLSLAISSSLATSSLLLTYLEEDLIFTNLLLSFTMRHVCLAPFPLLKLRKSDFLDEESLTAIVAMPSSSKSELSSFESHSCSM